MIDCRPYVLKTVALRFNGADVSFDLSHALFSSNDIDAGSRLLLKNIARYVEKGSVSSVLDIGSGTGVLGIACAKAYQAERLLLRDRDALAVAFSQHNAKRNKLRTCVCETNLFLDGLTGQHFDLVLCNVPAKAGTPVLDRFLQELQLVLTPAGVAGIVVVNTIAAAARASLQAAGVSLRAVDEGKGHTVFLLSRNEALVDTTATPVPMLECAVRTPVQTLTLAGRRYRFKGYYGLPEFDTHAYATQLAAEIIAAVVSGGAKRMLVCDPGPGHLPAFLNNSPKQRIDLCSRDALALAASRANIRLATAGNATQQDGQDFAFMEDITDHAGYDLLVAFPENIPGVDLADQFWAHTIRLLKSGGQVVAALGSTFYERLEKRRPRGFIKQREKKHRGHIAACWLYEGAADEIECETV